MDVSMALQPHAWWRIKNKLQQVKATVPVKNLEKATDRPKEPEKSVKDEEQQHAKGTAPAWTNRDECPPASVVSDWSKALKMDAELIKHFQKSWSSVALAMVAASVPIYGPKDFTIVRRGGVLELWATRDFKKHEILLAPVTSVSKDCYWTLGRAVLLPQSYVVSPERKPLVLDGRLRSTYDPDEDNSLTLFWIVEKTMDPNDANLTMEFPSIDCGASVVLPGRKKEVQVDTSLITNMTPPLLTNPAPVAAHTRLKAVDDLNLHKMTSKLKEKRKKEAEEKGDTGGKKPRA